MAERTFETRRIIVFICITFGISLLTSGVLYVTGGLIDSPEVVGTVTLSSLLLPTVYMFSPAIANVATRLLTGEGWSGLRIRLNLGQHWGSYIVSWLGTCVLIGAGFALYAVLRHLSLVSIVPSRPSIGVTTIVVSPTLGPAINTMVAVGEEFGWRGYLLPKFEPLGTRRALVAHGVIWGIWHWPLVAIGYNYGLDYPLAPWSGLVLITVGSVAIGTVFGALSQCTDSIWPAAFAHGTLNAIGSLAVVISGVGIVAATPVALVGVVPWTAAAGMILIRPDKISLGELNSSDANLSR